MKGIAAADSRNRFGGTSVRLLVHIYASRIDRSYVVTKRARSKATGVMLKLECLHFGRQCFALEECDAAHINAFVYARPCSWLPHCAVPKPTTTPCAAMMAAIVSGHGVAVGGSPSVNLEESSYSAVVLL